MKNQTIVLLSFLACFLFLIPNGIASNNAVVKDSIILKRVNSAKVTAKAYKTIKNHPSGEFSSLKWKKGKVLANPNIAILVYRDSPVIIPTNDLPPKNGPELVVYGLEIHKMTINGVTTTMMCKCKTWGGDDDCKFNKDSDDEVYCYSEKGGCPGNCERHVSMVGPDGVAQYEALAN